MVRNYKKKTAKVTEDINKLAEEYGFIIRQTSAGIITVPTQDGKQMSDEQLKSLDKEAVKDMKQKSSIIQEKILDTTNKIRNIEKEAASVLGDIDDKVALTSIELHIKE